jgi:hypothetical protein
LPKQEEVTFARILLALAISHKENETDTSRTIFASSLRSFTQHFVVPYLRLMSASLLAPLLFAFSLSLLSVVTAQGSPFYLFDASTYDCTQGCVFSNPAIWSGGSVPTAGSVVVIQGNNTASSMYPELHHRYTTTTPSTT